MFDDPIRTLGYALLACFALSDLVRAASRIKDVAIERGQA